MAGKSWSRRASDAWSYGIECARWVPWALGLVFLASTALFLSGMSDAGDRSEDVIARSRPAEGEVVLFSDREARGLRRGLVRYEVDGTVRSGEVVIADRQVSEGDTVALRYDPDDPAVVFAEGDRQPPGAEIPVWVAASFAVAVTAGIGTLFALLPRRKLPKLIGE